MKRIRSESSGNHRSYDPIMLRLSSDVCYAIGSGAGMPRPFSEADLQVPIIVDRYLMTMKIQTLTIEIWTNYLMM